MHQTLVRGHPSLTTRGLYSFKSEKLDVNRPPNFVLIHICLPNYYPPISDAPFTPNVPNLLNVNNMSSSVRPIVIDDSDSRIQYRGQGWFQDSGSQDAAGNFGPSYLDTEHGTNSNDSFSFSFRGDSFLYSLSLSAESALSSLILIRNLRWCLGHN